MTSDAADLPSPKPSPKLHPFEAGLATAWPPSSWQDLRIAIGVSGGPDSVALTRAMHRIVSHHQTPAPHTSILVLHMNHGWRGEESAADEAFVRDFCQQLDLPVHIGRPCPGSAITEDSARRDRYRFFREVAEKQGARYVLTAHNADDQVETVLHRIIRGTGIPGLMGIPPQRVLSEAVTIVRPLLAQSRPAIMGYLERLSQPYRLDKSNLQNRFTRSRIRHELLPVLEEYNPMVREALVKLSQLATDVQEVMSTEVDRTGPRCLVSQAPDRVELDMQALLQLGGYLQREILARVWREQAWPRQKMSFDHWTRIMQLARSESGRIELPGAISAEINQTRLVLCRFGTTSDDQQS